MSGMFKTALFVIKLMTYLLLGSALYQFASDGQWAFATAGVSMLFALMFIFMMLEEIYEKVDKR